jgi:hypothetical protein
MFGHTIAKVHAKPESESGFRAKLNPTEIKGGNGGIKWLKSRNNDIFAGPLAILHGTWRND